MNAGKIKHLSGELIQCHNWLQHLKNFNLTDWITPRITIQLQGVDARGRSQIIVVGADKQSIVPVAAILTAATETRIAELEAAIAVAMAEPYDPQYDDLPF